MGVDTNTFGILIFAKAPIPGQVKTRMQPQFTKNESSVLQSKLIQHTLETSKQVTDNVELWCHPTASHPYFISSSEQHGVPLHTQKGGDLGERMWHALNDALVRYERVALIGTDCPSLTPEKLLLSREHLSKKNVVLFAAQDGGYVLIGAKGNAPNCFKGIDWGTEKVLEQTRYQLDIKNESYAIPLELNDLDYYSDWLALPKVLKTKLSPTP